MKKLDIVVLTKKFGHLVGKISAVKSGGKYSYTLIDTAGNLFVLGEFDVDQLAKVKRVEEDMFYDYTALV